MGKVIPSMLMNILHEATLVAAPLLPKRFNLTMPTVETDPISIAKQIAIDCLNALLPFYNELQKANDRLIKFKESA